MADTNASRATPRWLAPTQRTQRLATMMTRHARATSGADAVTEFYGDLEAEQLLALVGVLLNRVVRPDVVPPAKKRLGRPPIPFTLTPEERRLLTRRWWQGDRSPEARLGFTEYRRERSQARRLNQKEADRG